MDLSKYGPHFCLIYYIFNSMFHPSGTSIQVVFIKTRFIIIMLSNGNSTDVTDTDHPAHPMQTTWQTLLRVILNYSI